VSGWLDTLRYGGDGANIFNVSSRGERLVCCGKRLAGGLSNGTRGVSGKSGSADLVESGKRCVNPGADTEQVGRCVKAVGVGFMFAPGRKITTVRWSMGRPRAQELGLRTLFQHAWADDQPCRGQAFRSLVYLPTNSEGRMAEGAQAPASESNVLGG